jgi:hypothetical protein
VSLPGARVYSCMSRINVAVAVAEESRERIYEVAAACRAFGFRTVLTLEGIGVFTGSVELKNLARLRSVAEVVAVEIERQPRLNAC